MSKIDNKKWRQYKQLTIDEAMSLIAGHEPGEYKFCGARESEMAPGSAHIYRALVNDIKKFQIVTHISGIKSDSYELSRVVHPDLLYDPHAAWWSTGFLQVDDIREWLKKQGFKSTFFDTDKADRTSLPDYLDNKLNQHSPKLAAAIAVWEHFYYNPENILPGKSLKKQMEKWLTDNAISLKLLHNKQVSKQAIEEIAKIAHWETKGGAPSQ